MNRIADAAERRAFWLSVLTDETVAPEYRLQAGRLLCRAMCLTAGR